MKKILIFAVTMFFGHQAFAACSGTLVTDANTALAGKTFEGSGGGDSWQEQHKAGGVLCEYAQGTGHAVDPSHNVGTWSASGTDGSVTYNYNGGSSYTFWLRQTGSTYYFCSNSSGSGSDVAFGAITSKVCTP